MLFDPKTMNYEPGWAFRPEICPCDQEFLEWFNTVGLGGQSIFHMGTGLHHKVGLDLAGSNYILGLTLSPAEILAYTELCKAEPWLPASYQVLFGDIAYLNFQFKPFDIINLFHLGEIVVSPHPRFQENTIRMVLTGLVEGGRVLAYRGSNSFVVVQPILLTYLVPVEEYKHLVIYKSK